MKSSASVLSLAAIIAALAGCAAQPTSSDTPAPAAAAKPGAKEIPALRVTTDCGACQVRSTVPGLIVVGYNNAAAQAGLKVSSTTEASVVIKEYAARDDTSRFIAGAFAGKDEIKAVVSYQGREFMVEDYYRNAWMGIQDLARKIGEMIVEKMK
jgi:hypothetical protein